MNKRTRIDLQLLKELWAEPDNWGKSLTQMCEELGWRYSTVAKKISQYGTDKFYEERNKLMRKNLQKIKDLAYKALSEKIAEGNVKALEMFLKMTGELTEKIEVSGTVNITVFTKKKIITRGSDGNQESDNS